MIHDDPPECTVCYADMTEPEWEQRHTLRSGAVVHEQCCPGHACRQWETHDDEQLVDGAQRCAAVTREPWGQCTRPTGHTGGHVSRAGNSNLYWRRPRATS